jgi:hypothetical protein
MIKKKSCGNHSQSFPLNAMNISKHTNGTRPLAGDAQPSMSVAKLRQTSKAVTLGQDDPNDA